MSKLRKYTNNIEKFLQSDVGQRFFNIAFSIGAAIVIWGALFEILHLRGGKTLLCVGMGTEILMFILTAFDRPPKDPNWEEIVPALRGDTPTQDVASLTIVEGKRKKVLPAIEIGNSEISSNSQLSAASGQFAEALENISRKIEELQAVMASANTNYMRQVEELNRNIAGINSIYELQLKNISGQLSSMDGLSSGLKEIHDMYKKSAKDSEKYCEETEKMTQYMKQINAVYANMLSAMTISPNQRS